MTNAETISKLNNALSTLIKAYEELQEHNNNLKSRINELEDEVLELEGAKEDLEKNVDEFKNHTQEDKSNISSMLGKIESILNRKSSDNTNASSSNTTQKVEEKKENILVLESEAITNTNSGNQPTNVLKKDDTKGKIIFQDTKEQKWFRIGEILNYQNEEKFDEFIEKFDSSFAKKALRQLRRTILEKEVINYFLEKEQDLDKALNIFIRINSGGEPLNFSDLIMSIAVANWENNDARQVIHSLVDNIRDKGFLISKDFILKVFLYLYSKDIKFKVTNFSKENAKDFEQKWSNIRNAILEVFDLIKTFGFTDSSLTSKNALIPVVYYIYHKSIVKDFSVSKSYENDRNIIKKWLHIMLIKMVFGSSSDSILSQIRHVFTDDFDNFKIDENINEFPFDKILNNIKKDTSISDEFIDTILSTQKEDKYAFSILSLLYPNLDYKNNNFHKDHLHPISKFTRDEIEKLHLNESIKNEYFHPSIYNGIYNLQMLDANENMSKNDLSLKDWIDKSTNSSTRKQFLDSHLIPDIDLSFENFKEFVDERKSIVKMKLKTILEK